MFLGLVFLILKSAVVKSSLAGTFLLAVVIPMSQHHVCSSERKNQERVKERVGNILEVNALKMSFLVEDSHGS